MYSGATVFSQLMQQLPWWRFQDLVDRYQGDYKAQTFRCAEHFRVMAFAQLTYRESLRDIEACLRAMGPKLYHMGIRSTASRNNLSNANENRDWRIYAEFAQILIQQAKALYIDDSTFPDLDATVYALDSTTIDLCMTMFPWAHFRRAKSAVKMHTLLNLCGNIPEFLRNQRECCQNADMDRQLCLSSRGDHEKAAEHRAVALHNSTDFECIRFRENAAFAGISERGALR
jgi:hypothetical protein